jgi:hypothetical protein
MGNYDPVEDLEFASHVFRGIESHYAPHAEVGSKAFVGEAYLLRRNVPKAEAAFKAALAVPLPSEAEAKTGRTLLQDIIRKRLNGSEQTLNELLGQAGLGSCNTCHLRISERIQSSLTAGATAAGLVTRNGRSWLSLFAIQAGESRFVGHSERASSDTQLPSDELAALWSATALAAGEGCEGTALSAMALDGSGTVVSIEDYGI